MKKEELEVPEDLKETPRQRQFDRRLIFIISLFLAVALTGFLAIFAKSKTAVSYKSTVPQTSPSPTANPTTDETTNWKTFESSKYPFSIKYPQNLSPQETISPFYSVLFRMIPVTQGEFSTYDLLAAPDTFQAEDPAGYDFIDTNTIHKLLSLGHNESVTIRTSVFKSTGQAIVGDQEATVFDVTSTQENVTHQQRVIFQKDGNNYVIVNWNGDPNQQEDFKKFLSTFKFTNQQAFAPSPTPKPLPNPNPGMKIYQTQSGFYFQYPDYLIYNNSSTPTSISLLQQEGDIKAQRLLVDIEKTDKSLTDFAHSNGYDHSDSYTTTLEPQTIDGHSALNIVDTIDMHPDCSKFDTVKAQRTGYFLVQLNGSIATFIVDDSCETQQTDWFSQIPPTIRFTQ